jgi:hypothetical protein
MQAACSFSVAFRVTVTDGSLAPTRVETTLRLVAPAPGKETEQINWLFFPDRLWNGEVSDEPPLRRAASDSPGVEVEAIGQHPGSAVHVVPTEAVKRRSRTRCAFCISFRGRGSSRERGLSSIDEEKAETDALLPASQQSRAQ